MSILEFKGDEITDDVIANRISRIPIHHRASGMIVRLTHVQAKSLALSRNGRINQPNELRPLMSNGALIQVCSADATKAGSS